MSENVEKNETFEFNGIFEVKAEDFEQKNQSMLSEDFYQTKLDDEKVKDGRYVTTGRLVPDVNCGEIRKDRVTKHVYYLPNPEDPTKKMYVDAPSNNPKSKDLCTAAYMKHVYDKGKNYDQSTPIQLSKKLEVLKRNTYHYALFLIYDDIQHPELNGKIKIMRFGKVLNDKLDFLLKGDQALKKKPIVPFDLINGKDLTIVVSEGNQNLPTYEQSFFNDGICGISFDCGKSTVAEFNAETGRQIFDFLKLNSPDLTQTYYKGTSEADEKLLTECVKSAFGEQYYDKFCELYFEVYGTPYVPNYNNVTNVKEESTTSSVADGRPAAVVTQPAAVVTTDKAVVTESSTTSNFKSLKESAVETVAEAPIETAPITTVVETVAEAPIVTAPIATTVETVAEAPIATSEASEYSTLDFDKIPDDIK